MNLYFFIIIIIFFFNPVSFFMSIRPLPTGWKRKNFNVLRFFFWREFRFSNKKMTIYIAISFFHCKVCSNWIELNMAERQIYKQNKKILYMRKNLWIFSYYFSFQFRFLSHTHTFSLMIIMRMYKFILITSNFDWQ